MVKRRSLLYPFIERFRKAAFFTYADVSGCIPDLKRVMHCVFQNNKRIVLLDEVTGK